MGLELVRRISVFVDLVAGCAVFLFLVLRDGLRELQQCTVKLPGAVPFYLRSFPVVLFLSALSAAIGTSFV